MSIYKMGPNYFTMELGGHSAEATMRKTALGWIVEVTTFEHWDAEKDTIYWWVATTAREAWKDCYHFLRGA